MLEVTVTSAPKETKMEYETFMNLPTAEIAQIVEAQGPHVCVFPINGTRRWFMLEHADIPSGESLPAYLEAMVQSHMRIYRLFFEHGLTTLLSPMIGSVILKRGPNYIQAVPRGFARLINHPDFERLCREFEVRARFYGDYQGGLSGTPYQHLAPFLHGIEQEIIKQTEAYGRHRLYFGLFADDPTGTIANLSVQYYQEHGRIPDKRTLNELYYGEYVPPVDLFIGFDEFAVFDMPLIATGTESLYFTVAPSLYFTAHQLRRILYDHLFARQQGNNDYGQMGPEDWDFMKTFYRANLGNVIGIGKKVKPDGIWYPLPQVSWPPE
jgi:tuberculosinol/isotuberculosinol synthase